jgi:hypothetical protein
MISKSAWQENRTEEGVARCADKQEFYAGSLGEFMKGMWGFLPGYGVSYLASLQFLSITHLEYVVIRKALASD